MAVYLARRAARSKLALTFAVITAITPPAFAETRHRPSQASAHQSAAPSPRTQARVQHAPALASQATLRAEITQWQSLFSGGTFTQTANFMLSHNHWPKVLEVRGDRSDLRDLAETRLTSSDSDGTIMNYFSAYDPRSPRALDAYYGALTRSGDAPKAIAAVKKFWLNGNMGQQDQLTYLDRYRGLITSHEVYQRASRLVWEDKVSHAQAISGAVTGNERAILRARLALRGGEGNMSSLIAAVPANLSNDAGLVHDRVRYRNTHDDEAGAIDLLLQNPVSADGKIADWWRQRENLALVSLRNGQVDTAYRLASEHGFPKATTEQYMGAEWLSGWIALRFKNDPAVAAKHFTNMFSVAVSVVSRARGAYWLARTAQALGDQDKAKGWYQYAAKNSTAFYGQAAAIDLYGQVDISAPPDLRATATEQSDFESKDLVHIIRAAQQIGNPDIIRAFFMAQVEDIKTQGEASLTVALATELHRPDLASWAAKNAGRKGFVVGQQGYPVLGNLPSAPEKALISAIIRQESGAYQYAKSGAGALGYMQIMPGTGTELARKMGLSTSSSRLLNDGPHNIQLGSFFLESLIEKFGGSYVLAAAAYNGGPARVSRWVDQIGDPRSPSPPISRYMQGRKSNDPAHWMAMDVIEAYPIGETRFYIHQVTSGMEIYRAMLESDHTARLGLKRSLLSCDAPC